MQGCTEGYSGVDTAAMTWGGGFGDGRALCALIHKHSPDSFDGGYDALDGLSDDMARLAKALDVAEVSFGAPKPLDLTCYRDCTCDLTIL